MILAITSLMKHGLSLTVFGFAFSLMFFLLTGFQRKTDSAALSKPPSAARGRVLFGFHARWYGLVIAGVGLVIMIIAAL